MGIVWPLWKAFASGESTQKICGALLSKGFSGQPVKPRRKRREFDLSATTCASYLPKSARLTIQSRWRDRGPVRRRSRDCPGTLKVTAAKRGRLSTIKLL